MRQISIDEKPSKVDFLIDLGAERSVLGILLRQIEYIDVVGYLTAQHFYNSFHGKVYQCIVEMAAESTAIDPLTVYDGLRIRGWDARAKDVRGYLFDLVEAAGPICNLEAHAAIVIEKALMRQLRVTAQDAQKLVFENRELSSTELLETVSDKFALLSGNFTRDEPTPLQGRNGTLALFIENLDKMATGEKNPNIVPTYIKDLDEKFLNGGLFLGNTYVIGARPSMGKTALATSIIVSQARNGWAVGALTLEMTKDEYTGRIISNVAEMNYGPLASGKMSEDDWVRLTAALSLLQESELFIEDEPALTLLGVQAKIRSMIRQSQGKLKVVVIDYLQLMTGDNINRQQMLGEISRGLKRLAKIFNIAIIELSQLNRQIEHRPDKRPTLADLRESGDIEADADVVLMPYREFKDNPSSDYPDLVDLYVTKNRNGPTGWMPMRFMDKCMKFKDWAGAAVEEMSLRKRGGVVRRNGFEG